MAQRLVPYPWMAARKNTAQGQDFQQYGYHLDLSFAECMIALVFDSETLSKTAERGLRHLVVLISKLIWDLKNGFRFDKLQFAFQALQGRLVILTKQFGDHRHNS